MFEMFIDWLHTRRVLRIMHLAHRLQGCGHPRAKRDLRELGEYFVELSKLL